MDLDKELIKKHEGLSLKPYKCSAGKTTIGFGRNLDDAGITEEEAEILLENDTIRARADAAQFVSNFETLAYMRQCVLVDMAFNLGLTRLSQFKVLKAALERGDYSCAADSMLASKWAAQVGSRAVELANIMRTGSTA
jgi:lysozyme